MPENQCLMGLYLHPDKRKKEEKKMRRKKKKRRANQEYKFKSLVSCLLYYIPSAK